MLQEIKTRSDTLILLCSRPDSKRLARKCFRIIAGVSALGHILARLGKIDPPLPTILAVPKGMNAADYELYERTVKPWPCVQIFAGHPESPLHRMAEAILAYSKRHESPLYVVRITHDDILIDPLALVELLEICRQRRAGYGITPGILGGAGVEVIATENLLAAAERHREPVEYVSYFVRGGDVPNPDILSLAVRESIRRPYNLTLDYPEDAVVLETIMRTLGPYATNEKICAYLDQNAHLLFYNRRPQVSVYTCARNASPWIDQTILSAQYALGEEGEYVFVDDASTDDTLTRAMNHLGRDNVNIIVNEQQNGLASSCNVALGAARGRYVMRLDADDILMPWAIAYMMEIIQDQNAAVVYAAYQKIDSNGAIIERDCDPRIHHHAGCALMDSKFINELRFRDGLQHWDSLELYQRIEGRFPIAYIDEPLWFYRQHDKSLSHSNHHERRQVLESLKNE